MTKGFLTGLFVSLILTTSAFAQTIKFEAGVNPSDPSTYIFKATNISENDYTIEISILNIVGNVVFTFTPDDFILQKHAFYLDAYDASNLDPGIYFVQFVYTDNKTKVQARIVRQIRQS